MADWIGQATLRNRIRMGVSEREAGGWQGRRMASEQGGRGGVTRDEGNGPEGEGLRPVLIIIHHPHTAPTPHAWPWTVQAANAVLAQDHAALRHEFNQDPSAAREGIKAALVYLRVRERHTCMRGAVSRPA
jgi:hypothetical protein